MSITNEQIQQLVFGLQETARKAAELAIRDAMARQYEIWQEAIAGGGTTPPQNVVQIPVIYVGTNPAGVFSVTMLADLLWSKLKPIAIGGGAGVFSAMVNDKISDTFNLAGWQVVPCGPAGVVLFEVTAVQYVPIDDGDITWNTVTLQEQPAVAKLVVTGDGLTIEVKEQP